MIGHDEMSNPKLIERLEKIARANHEEDVEAGRAITFTVCDICGFAEWLMSGKPGEGFKVQAESRSSGDCERCMTAVSRAPEVCRWVMGVIAHSAMMRDAEEKASA